jgi:hypothetical protein
MGLLVWVLSARYWFQVWGRLGTAESYAAFGVTLWALGIHLLWPRGDAPGRYRRLSGLLAVLIGNAVVVGAKENLLVLAVPNAIVALIEMSRGRTGGHLWWACLANMEVAAAVAAPLAVYFAQKPVDYYGQSVGVAQRFAVLRRGMTQWTFAHLAFLAAVPLWLGSRLLAVAGRVRLGDPWRRLSSCLVLWTAGGLSLFVSQFVLYNGDITPDTHYQFPAALAGPAIVVASSLCLRDVFRRVGDSRAERVVYHATAVALVCAALVSLPGLREQRAWSTGWAAATREFTDRVTAAAATARAEAGVPIVLVSGRPFDLEPIISVERFLRALGATNPKLVLLTGPRRARNGRRSKSIWRPTSSAWRERGHRSRPRIDVRFDGSVLQHRTEP